MAAVGRSDRARARPRSGQRNWPRHARRSGAVRFLAFRPRIEGQRTHRLQRAEGGLLRGRRPARAVRAGATNGRGLRRQGSARIPRTNSRRAQPAGHFSAHNDCGRSRRLFRRRIRAGARLRSHRCGQDGAVLLSGIAARSDPRIRRNSAAEAGHRQRAWCATCC